MFAMPYGIQPCPKHQSSSDSLSETWNVCPRIRSWDSNSAWDHRIYLSTRTIADYQRRFTVLPDSSNRDDHLVRTLVTILCSSLYLFTSLMSGIAFGNQHVFWTLTSYSNPEAVSRSATIW